VLKVCEIRSLTTVVVLRDRSHTEVTDPTLVQISADQCEEYCLEVKGQSGLLFNKSILLIILGEWHLAIDLFAAVSGCKDGTCHHLLERCPQSTDLVSQHSDSR
jgi:hypothetical protein